MTCIKLSSTLLHLLNEKKKKRKKGDEWDINMKTSIKKNKKEKGTQRADSMCR